MHPVLFHLGNLVIPSYGAIAAIGVLLALVLAQRTARVTGLAPNHVWNLSVSALFAALVGSRLVLVVVNWRSLVHHPMWLLGLATIHHPILAGAGLLFGAAAVLLYARWQRMPLITIADTLAAPLALLAAMEQFGALLAGAGFGVETSARWAIVYTNPLAARWSGAPLGVPVHPVQAYAALALAGLTIVMLMALPLRKQAGDIAGLALMGGGVIVYITECWRDWEGRGAVLGGAVDGPQIAAVAMVVAGALLLLQRKAHHQGLELQHG